MGWDPPRATHWSQFDVEVAGGKLLKPGTAGVENVTGKERASEQPAIKEWVQKFAAVRGLMGPHVTCASAERANALTAQLRGVQDGEGATACMFNSSKCIRSVNSAGPEEPTRARRRNPNSRLGI